MQNEWKFSAPKNMAVITTKKIVNGSTGIMFVSHDAEDAGWQFLEKDAAPEEADAAVVSLDDIVALDSSIEEIADLPPGWIAKRDNIGDSWQRVESSF